MAELEVAQRESDADNRARVIAVQECADRAAEAKVRVAEENARIAREAAAAAEAAKEAAAEQARADLEAKRELIRQIRALEAAALALVGVSSGAGAVLDRTQTCGTGLLTEMSVAELKERLSAAKTMAAESEEARRKEINTGRDERVRKVAQAAEYVAQARLVASTATSSQRSTGFSTRSKYGTASRGGGATPTLDRSGLGGISSILDEAAARLQAHSQVDDMEKQLALKRLGMSSSCQPYCGSRIGLANDTSVHTSLDMSSRTIEAGQGKPSLAAPIPSPDQAYSQAH
ncbi:hypothetical protein BC828DRAFT_65445 [Blastocladiella britannica]|nr:hypothetical protein BC828DRAFT_65445 [Blastocladiella britannica]